MKNKDKRKTIKETFKSHIKSSTPKLSDGIFNFVGAMSIKEFANNIQKNSVEIITYFFKKGIAMSINTILNEEQIAEICLHFGLDFEKKMDVSNKNVMDLVVAVDEEADMKSRPPIITIMGHVDHGKTTLIDYIRKSKIAKNEAGGITQHTGAYQINYNDHKITFLDTPGHEAFTSMRSRGANITDIVVLVVAADDSVMPQTKEAIAHALNAKVQIIVFVNKMDKKGANPEKVRSEMAMNKIMCEEWGGEFPFVYGSALTGEGVNELLENILLHADLLDLKSNPNRLAIGRVIESFLDPLQGPIAKIIITNGTLYKRDFVLVGSNYGKIKKMNDSQNKEIKVAYPSDPIVILGLNHLPEAGQKLFGFKDEKYAKELAEKKRVQDKKDQLMNRKIISEEDGQKYLNIIIKADAKGTSEALKASLSKIHNDEVQVNIINVSIGAISKSDILLAQVSNAIIYGFNIRTTGQIKTFAKDKKVIIKSENVIYNIIQEIEKIIKGMKEPIYDEKVVGEAEIIKVIFSSKVGNIAGSVVNSGEIRSNSLVRIIRNGIEKVFSKIDSLYQNKNSVKKVGKGQEFGCHIKKFNDIKIGDIIQTFEKVKREEE